MSNLYRSASMRYRMTFGGPKLLSSALAPNPATKVLAIFLISCLGIVAGSAAGAGINLMKGEEKPPIQVAAAAAAPEPELKIEVPLVPVVPAPVVVAPAPVAVAVPKPAPVVVPKPKPVVKAPIVVPVAPAPVVPQVVAPAARCAANQQMDDTKINWLLDQSAKTLAENPGQAAGAARVDAGLRSALGQNMCAAEAQSMIANTCTDPAAVKFLNTMVSRLPFFIKPMVGNPCTADLVAVLNKMGKFIS